MKLRFYKSVCLFGLPLLVPTLAFCIRFVESNKPLRHQGGGWKSDLSGERVALRSLSFYLEANPTQNILSTDYTVTRLHDPHKGTSIYSLEYDRRNKTLVKSALVPPLKSVNEAPRIWVWSNVEESAIHQVSAPVRALRFTQQVEDYKGGNLPELAQHGATLTRTP